MNDPGSYSNGFDGLMDELRISKGVCRYTESFTPEVGAYTNPAATERILLKSNDTDNQLGNTIKPTILEGLTHTVNVAGTKVADFDAGGLNVVGNISMKVFDQSAEPDTDDIPAGEMAMWTDTDDSKCYLCYNHGGTIKTVELT